MSGTLRLQLQTRCRQAKRVGTQGTAWCSFLSSVKLFEFGEAGKKNDFSVFSVFFCPGSKPGLYGVSKSTEVQVCRDWW